MNFIEKIAATVVGSVIAGAISRKLQMRTGLVNFDSEPKNATIFIDNKILINPKTILRTAYNAY